MKLVECPNCSRHVRVDETVCPFCDAALEGLTPRELEPLRERSRAAVLFIGAAALAGCGKDAATPPDAGPVTGPTETYVAAPPYGVAPVEPNTQAVPAYGVPPQDLTPPDAGATKLKRPRRDH